MTPDELHAEKKALLAEIYEAFKGVSREGGVSWSEAVVIDDYGTDEERAAAREQDKEWGWEELVDDPSWGPQTGCGGFSFLDATGFRYYLAPAMVRSVREGMDVGVRFHLTVTSEGDRMHDWFIEKMSALGKRQRGCVARFIRFMVEWSRCFGFEVDVEYWTEALESHWKQY